MKSRMCLVFVVVFAAMSLITVSCTNEPSGEEKKPEKEEKKLTFRPSRTSAIKYTEDALIRLGACTNEHVFLYMICKIDDAIRSTSLAKKNCEGMHLDEKFNLAMKNMYDARALLVHANEKYRGVERFSLEDDERNISPEILVSFDDFYREEALYPITPAEILYMNDYYKKSMTLVNKAIKELYVVREQLQ